MRSTSRRTVTGSICTVTLPPAAVSMAAIVCFSRSASSADFLGDSARPISRRFHGELRVRGRSKTRSSGVVDTCRAVLQSGSQCVLRP